jgi:lipid A 3-O-deacylase
VIPIVRSLLRTSLVGILLLLSTEEVAAQGLSLERETRITVDNDYFQFWRSPHARPDDNYTQGLRIERDLSNDAALFRRWCRSGSACEVKFAIGQEMYTPTVDGVDPVPGERPYGGWIYLRASGISATRVRRSILEATFGLTGKPSLAEQTQDAFHALFPGFRRPLGWSHQLPTEPDVAFTAREEFMIPVPSVARRWLSVTPNAHATVGTLRTDAGVGATARVGIALQHPWLRESQGSAFEAYVVVGAGADVIARDLFLDGGTFRASGHVERESLVGTWERGIAVRTRQLVLEYRAITNSREYRTGPPTHTYGRIALAWRADP